MRHLRGRLQNNMQGKQEARVHPMRTVNKILQRTFASASELITAFMELLG